MDSKDYKAFFEQSSELLLVIDTEFTVMAASDAYLHATKTLRENITGQNFFSVFPNNPGDKSANGETNIRASLNRVLKTKAVDTITVLKYDIQNPVAEGVGVAVKYWRVLHSPHLDEFNEVKYIVLHVQNVTAHAGLLAQLEAEKKAAKLVGSEKRSFHLLMQSPFGFSLMKGKQMVITLANDIIKDFWGEGKEVEGKTLLELLPELEGQPFPAILDNVFTTGIPFHDKEILDPFDRQGITEDRYFNVIYQPNHEADETISGVATIVYEVTEMVLARKKIEESEERFRLLVTQAPAAICILKGNKYMVEVVNDFYLKIVRKGKEFIGKLLFQSLPELKTQGIKELLDNVMQTGIPYYGNELELYIYRNEKKEQGFYNFIYQPFRETDGIITGIIVVASEVTEQVQARKKMEVQNLLFKDMLMTAPGFVCTLSGPHHVYELVNAQYQSLFGTRQIQGKPIMVALPELEGQGFDQLLDNVYNTGEPYVGIDIPIVLARDENLAPELRYFNFSYQPMYDENKKIYSILVFGYEVTEQMIAKKRVEESEVHYRQMAELIPSKITNADAAGGVLYCNKEWLDFTGLDFAEFKNFGYHNIMHPDELDEFQQRFKQASETGTNLTMEMRFLNKEGDYKWHLNLASPVKDENGKIKMWIGSTTDIEHLKEEEFRKGNFIKMVSHELKTPVTTIKGYVQLLLMLLEDEKQKTDTEHIKQSLVRVERQVKKLTRLIVEMLDLTRIEESKLTMQNSDVNLNDLVSETLEDFKNANLPHTIKLYQEYACIVSGDKDRLEQVLINFVANAIKYSPGNGNIEVRVFKAKENFVSVSVKDEGIGIDTAEHQKIFERFYRVSGKNELLYAGFGIGLFIAKAIVESHHGFISLESEKGKGALFTFTIPCTQTRQEKS